MIKKRPLVVVEWHDTSLEVDWQCEEHSYDVEPVYCQSVGWVLPNKKQCLLLVPTRNDKETSSARLAIPLGCITNIRRIE